MSENNGALAQLGEHLLCKQGVIGSIPISSTIFCWPDRLSKKSGDFLGIWLSCVLTPYAPSALAPDGGGERSPARGRARWVASEASRGQEGPKPQGFARPTGRRRSCGAPAQARPSQMADTAVSEKDLILEKKVCTALAVLFCIHREEKIVSESCFVVARLTPLAEAVMSDD